jgi:histidinol dehydrogenase
MQILSTKEYSLSKLLTFIRARQSKKTDVKEVVNKIIENVKENKDAALFALTKKFDGADLKTLEVSEQEIIEAYKQEKVEVIKALKKAKENIEKFHRSNIKTKERKVVTAKGVKAWREFRPIEKVGLYAPGGKAAYPSTVLMLATPAKIAGCKEIVLCVPPDKDGKIPSAVLVAADLCGI